MIFVLSVPCFYHIKSKCQPTHFAAQFKVLRKSLQVSRWAMAARSWSRSIAQMAP